MLHKYECEKCGGVCYIESEVWESCPICEETPEERKLRERAEQVERERDELREIAHAAGIALYWMLEEPYNNKVRQKAYDAESRISIVLGEK